MRVLILCFLTVGILVASARSQDTSHDMAGHDHGPQSQTSMSGMDMSQSSPMPDWMPSSHASSGTDWQPAATPAHLWMKSFGGWDLMAHGVFLLTYNHQGGPRGAGKAESVNYLMTMEEHRLGPGTLLFRQMFSAESLTSPHPGFPELFQTGETYHGQPLVDHQHPHNVFAELSALYTAPISEKVSWLLYGGPAAEPALGPVTYIHRASAAELLRRQGRRRIGPPALAW